MPPLPNPLPRGEREINSTPLTGGSTFISPALDGQWLVEEGARGRVKEVFSDERGNAL